MRSLNIPEGINPISSYDNTAQIIIEGNEAYYMDNPYNIDIAVTTKDKTKVYMVNVEMVIMIIFILLKMGIFLL